MADPGQGAPRRLVLLAVLAVFGAVSLEMGLRARLAFNNHVIFEADGLFYYPPHTQVGPRPEYRTSVDGFFGDDLTLPKPDGVFRVVVLGSSPVAEPLLPPAFRDALRARMPNTRVEVATAALPRYTSYQTMRLFEHRVVPLEPDCIVVYLGLNDNVYNTFPDRGEAPYDGYYRPWDFTRSVLLDMAWFQAVTKRRNVSPGFETMPSVPVYERHLRAMLDHAAAHGVRVVFVPIVCAWPTDDSALAQRILDNEGPMSHFWGRLEPALRGVQAHREVMASLASAPGAHYCVIDSQLPRDGAVFRDLCHFTPEGITRFGEALANCVADSIGFTLD